MSDDIQQAMMKILGTTIEQGFVMHGPDGQYWFVSLEKVGWDYVEYLRVTDNLSPEAAIDAALHEKEFWPNWFAEKFDFDDVVALGSVYTGDVREITQSDRHSIDDFVAIGF